MSSLPLLSLATFLPLLGAAAILLMPRAEIARWIALITTIVTFVVSLMVWASFDYANPGFQLVEKLNWLGGGISYHMGVDGISMLFVVLTVQCFRAAAVAGGGACTGQFPVPCHGQ